MTLSKAIEIVDKHVTDPSEGLPSEVFYFISRMTPMINVDLLIKDENGRTLLAWRDDFHSGKGWHIPGGIIRFRETFETRIKKVALEEIGVEVDHKKEPIAINEIIHNKIKERSHFISLLYECFLSEKYIPENRNLTPENPGYLKWHEKCPDDLLEYHDIYKKYI